MAIAWTLANAYVDFKDKINDIIINKKLSPWVHNKTIQKICESFRISNEDKAYLKTLKIKNSRCLCIDFLLYYLLTMLFHFTIIQLI